MIWMFSLLILSTAQADPHNTKKCETERLAFIDSYDKWERCDYQATIDKKNSIGVCEGERLESERDREALAKCEEGNE